MLIAGLLSLVTTGASAQQLPSNVYRAPTDNFNQGAQPIVYPPRQVYPPGQPVPQYQPVPSTQQFYYPQSNQAPIYQRPIQRVQGAVVPQQVQTVPAANSAEITELRLSLVKARDLMQKYQLKLEEVARKNQELESEIATLHSPGDMSDSGDSKELAAAKAAASQAQRQMSGLNDQLKNALRDLQTSTADLENQKKIGTRLQQQITDLEKTAKMVSGSNQQVAQLTENVKRFQSRNDELSEQVTALQSALREKETQIANMGSGDDVKLADLKELLAESENTNNELDSINKQLSLKLKETEANAAEMAAPPTNPELDELRADNQQLGQQNQQLGQMKQQLEAENIRLNDMLGKLRSENSELDATVSRLSNMPAPVEATEVTAAASSTSLNVTGLQNQLAAATRRNGQLERQLKRSESRYASLTDENAQLMEHADSESLIEDAAAPVTVASVASVESDESDESDVAPVTAAIGELGLNSVSAGWPVKYWIFGMLGVGLAVGLIVAWYESVVDPKSLRRSANSVSNQ